jgi:2',3'-cyclic-nucleotide 2'-phosphodiesterase (5'-nucleotidase family)
VAPEVDDWLLAPTARTGALKGGVARRATLIDQQRAAMADTVVLSSGDSTQGTLAAVPFTTANFDMQLMKAMGYDAVALGNHEFDLTSAALAMAVTAASANGGLGAPQLVLTNIKFSGTSADASLAALYGPGKAIAPSHVITTPSGLKVGVVASMGTAAASVAAPFAAPVSFTNGLPPSSSTNSLVAAAALTTIVAQLQPAVTALRNDAKVDVVILLSHGGVVEGSGSNEDELLAARLTGLDLVLGGHSHAAAQPVRYVNDPQGHKVALLQTSPYGKELGRAELVWLEGDRPRLDTDSTRTKYIMVDDKVLPTSKPAVTTLIGHLVGALELMPLPGSTSSFLEATLTAAVGPTLGAPVVYDPVAGPGSLYFYQLGTTTFPIHGLGTGESNMLNLDTDAMLAAADAIHGAGTTQVALQARGSMRANLEPGQTGAISFADVYRVAPLGFDPVTPSPGYPILRFNLWAAELRGALEGTLLMALQDPDYYVSPSGLLVRYDRTRPMFDATDTTGLKPGWITYMATTDPDGQNPVPFFDVSLSPVGWLGPTAPLTMVPTVATYQLGAFAASLGIKPRIIDPPYTKVESANLYTLIMRRPGGSAVKDHQALASYVYAISGDPGVDLPSIYDATTPEGQIPRRMVCEGSDCPP